MTNDTLIPNRIVKRARDPKIKEPKSPKEKKDQAQRQKEMAEIIAQGKAREAAEARKKALEAGSANQESEVMGVLSGRAAEMPIINQRGKRTRYAADNADETETVGGPLRRQKTRRKIRG